MNGVEPSASVDVRGTWKPYMVVYELIKGMSGGVKQQATFFSVRRGGEKNFGVPSSRRGNQRRMIIE